MAKFTNKDLRLADGQKVTWGTGLDANMWYDGTADQLKIDVTISGIAPTENAHLTTKLYVDNEITTVSGALNSGLTAHTSDATIHFTEASIDHGSIDGLGDDDHTQYSLADGTRAFTGVVGGVTPTDNAHLTTKSYVDDHTWLEEDITDLDKYTQAEVDSLISTTSGTLQDQVDNLDGTYATDAELATVSGALNSDLTDHTGDGTIHFTEASIDHGSIDGLGDDDHTQYSLADGTRAFTGVVGGVTPTDNAHLTTKSYVDDHTWLEEDITDLDKYTQAEVDSLISTTSGTLQDDVVWEAVDTPTTQIRPKSAHINKAAYFGSHLTIGGNLTVSGTTTTVNSEELTVTDKIITVNNGEVGAGLTGGNNAGIEVDRGSETNYWFVFDEDELNFRVGISGSLQAVATRQDTPLDGYLATWNDSAVRFDTNIEVSTDETLAGDSDTAIPTEQAVKAYVDDHNWSESDITDLDKYTQAEVDSLISTTSGTLQDQVDNLDGTYATDAELATVSGALNSDLTDHTGDATIHFTEASIDHGSIDGLGDDDHTQYSKADGTRAFTGVVSGVTPTADAHLSTKAYVDSQTSAVNQDHNSLTGLQGGISNEYYHLKSTTYSGLFSSTSGIGVGEESGTNFFVNTESDSTSATVDNVAIMRFTDTEQLIGKSGTSTLKLNADGALITVSGTDELKIDNDGITLGTGASVDEFSIDGTLAGNSDDAVPTEKAVKTYVDAHTWLEGDITDLDKYTQAEVDSLVSTTSGTLQDQIDGHDHTSIVDGDSNATITDADSFTVTIDGTQVMKYDDATNSIGIGLDTPNTWSSVYIGNEAGDSNTAVENIGIGYRAASGDTSGDHVRCTAIGFRAAKDTAENVTAVGYDAAYNCTGNGYITAIGTYAGQGVGAGCTAIGSAAAQDSTGSIHVIAVGGAACYESTGSYLVGVGNSALRNTEGDNNVAIGYRAGAYGTVDTENNVFVGNDSGYSTEGSGNVFLGYTSGYQSDGSDNVFIGNEAGKSYSSSNKLIIENSTDTTNPLVYGEFGTSSTNKLCINTSTSTTSGAGLTVNGEISLSTGTYVNEFSIDGTLAGNSDDAVPTEKAVKTYVDSLQDDVVWEAVDTPTTQIRPKTAHINKAAYFGSHLTIGGNLTVSGTTTTVNSEELTVTDKIITVNNGEAGAGLTGGSNAGIEVDRGSETNYWFVFDEDELNFRVGISGSLQAVATRQDDPTGGYLATWNDSAVRFDTNIEVSTDDTMADDSDTAIPTEQAVKAYVDNQIDSHDHTSIVDGDSNATITDADSFTVTIDGSQVMKYDDATDSISIGRNTTNVSGTVYIGDEAGRDNTAIDNIGIGFQAAYGDGGGEHTRCTAIGYRAAKNTGENVTAVGYDAAYGCTDKWGITAIGTFAGTEVGDLNTAIGFRALSQTEGDNNVAVGYRAGSYGTASTYNNVFLGYDSGRLTEGSGNVFIGYDSGKEYSSSNKLIIENSTDTTNPLVYGEFGTSSTNKLCINTSTPATTGAGLTVNGEISLSLGASIDEFSTDETLAGDSDTAIPTEQAVKAYVDDHTWLEADITNLDKYTQAEVDSLVSTTSGTLQDQIDDKADTNHDHTSIVDGDSNATITDADSFTVTIDGSQRMKYDEATNSLSIGPDTPNTSNSVYIGNTAGSGNTATENVGIGYQAASGDASGDHERCVAIGYQAAAATARNVTAVGYQAAYDCTDKVSITAVGTYAGMGVDNRSTAIGFKALYQTGGENNIGLGFYAGGEGSVDTDNNVFIGYNSGYTTSGSNNVFLGHQTGRATDGSGNVFIGSEAGKNYSTDNKLLIENSDDTTNPLVYGEFGTSSTNKLCINTSTPATTGAGLTVNGGIALSTGTDVNEFSIDGTLAGNSDDAVPTEKAVKTYVDSLQDDVVWEAVDTPTTQIRPKSAHINKAAYFGSHLTIGGNLTVSGTTTTVNSEELTVTDKIITVNNGEAGAGLTGGNNAGIEVDRGSETNYWFVFDETQDNFRVGISGSLQAVATRQDTPSDGYLATWNNTDVRFDTNIEVSTDDTMAGDSDTAIPTEQAVKAYVDDQIDSHDHTSIVDGDSNATITDADSFTVTIDGSQVMKYDDATNSIGIGPDTPNTSNSVYIGDEAGNGNTATGSVGIGYQAASGDASGDHERCVAIGYQAAAATARNVTAIGYQAAYDCTDKISVTAVGTYAGMGVDNYSTAIGYQALYQTAGESNTALGYYAGAAGSSGTYNNVFIGYKTGSAADGYGNVFIGSEAGKNYSGSNKLLIENSIDTTNPLVYGEFGTSSTNKLCINTNTPATTGAGLTVNGEIALSTGTYVNEFSTDGTLAGNSDDAVPTEQAVKTYVNATVVTDHGTLTGRDDDDHTQYILVDGSRGFTSTVSGVTPTQDYHLATKSYVDEGGIDRHGRESISNGASTVSVTFSDLGHTNYTVNATLENTTDSPPSIYAFIVTAKSSTGFTVTLMGDTDSANYKLNWSVIED